MSAGYPLAGVRVVLTRARHQTGALMTAFEAAGARVELLPLLEVLPPADPGPLEAALQKLGSFDWLVLSSANAVGACGAHHDGPWPRVAVVGPATAAALRRHGVEPDLEARQSDANGLADALAERVRGQRVLLPQADDARPELERRLRAAGAQVVAVVAYSKHLPAEAFAQAERLFAREPIGWVVFTSPRTVQCFVEVLGASWPERCGELRALTIGPTTAAELERRGVTAVTAARPTPEAMVAAMIAATHR